MILSVIKCNTVQTQRIMPIQQPLLAVGERQLLRKILHFLKCDHPIFRAPNTSTDKIS